MEFGEQIIDILDYISKNPFVIGAAIFTGAIFLAVIVIIIVFFIKIMKDWNNF